MGTIPAWQLREMQRRDLLLELMGEAIRAEEKLTRTREEFMTELAKLLLDKLSGGRPTGSYPWHHFLDQVVIPKVEGLARSSQEVDALLALFLEKYVLPDALTRVLSTLSNQELLNPKLIFGTEISTDEVEIPAD